MVIATLLVVVSAVASMTSAVPIFNLLDYSVSDCNECGSSGIISNIACILTCDGSEEDNSSDDEEIEISGSQDTTPSGSVHSSSIAGPTSTPCKTTAAPKAAETTPAKAEAPSVPIAVTPPSEDTVSTTPPEN